MTHNTPTESPLQTLRALRDAEREARAAGDREAADAIGRLADLRAMALRGGRAAAPRPAGYERELAASLAAGAAGDRRAR